MTDPTKEGRIIGQPEIPKLVPKHGDNMRVCDPMGQNAPMDIRAEAWEMLKRIMRGDALNPRLADTQRRAAMDILDLTSLEYMSDGELEAHADSVASELERRANLRAGKPAPASARPRKERRR